VVANGLTACAGIAFVKSSYPFHYAVELAESLCKRAKKKAKDIDPDLVPSCLMFHKVQDSFVEDFTEIVERELKPQPNLSFENGPYYCGKHALSLRCSNTIDELLDNIKQLEGKEGNAIKSHLRQWTSLLFGNVGAANQDMKRIVTLSKKDIIDKLNFKNFTSLQTIAKEKWKKCNAIVNEFNKDKKTDKAELENKLKNEIGITGENNKLVLGNFLTIEMLFNKNEFILYPIRIPFYDMLSLASILFIETKKKEEKK
jgi:hypothetical protein